jgi:hypothetical protein
MTADGRRSFTENPFVRNIPLAQPLCKVLGGALVNFD